MKHVIQHSITLSSLSLQWFLAFHHHYYFLSLPSKTWRLSRVGQLENILDLTTQPPFLFILSSPELDSEQCLMYTWLIPREFTWNDGLENPLQDQNGESPLRDCHLRSRTKISCWEIEMQKANMSKKPITYMQLLVLILAIPNVCLFVYMTRTCL